VQQAESWWATRTRNNVRELTYDHDWTFTSSYWGSIQGEVSFVTHIGSDCIDDFLPLGTIADPSIPLCTFKEVDFWEDELDDNGCSKMGLKLRVTEKYFYILMRFELRLDNVLSSRSLETRIYHELGSSRLLREFKWVEAGVEQRQHRVNQVIRITS
jgi:type 2A phosphatase activator TIP41